MTFGKATALAAGFVGAMALGVWMGPYITDREGILTSDHTAVVEQTPLALDAPPAAAAPPRSRPAPPMPTVVAKAPPIASTAPALHERIKPLLRKGADMTIAGEGFHSGEEFAAAAHASKNLDVPFMLLKHRMVDEKKSLADAIRESKPDVNARAEADRAHVAARADIASLN